MIGQNPAPLDEAVSAWADVSQQVEYRAILVRAVAGMERGVVRPRIPAPRFLLQRHEGMHHHFRPEIFVQVQGATEFRFVDGAMRLSPGEVAVLPAGLPHGESIATEGSGGGDAASMFRCLVVGFHACSVSMHVARDCMAARPGIDPVRFYSTPDLRRLVELAEFLVQVQQPVGTLKEAASRGLGLALFATLAELAQGETPDLMRESARVFQIKWLVREQLCNVSLNVTFLAARLGCSADHLSHVFHRDTGETLIHYIQRQRLRAALELIGRPALTVSEIAWSCGFADAGYFSRVFRKHTGFSPVAYRRLLRARLTQAEGNPETVFHDRMEFSAGRPATWGCLVD
jgi:AraC-like DNA-binding protein